MNTESYESRADSLVTIKISAVGDLMCHSVQFNYARVGEDSFDFNSVYRFVGHYLKSSDFTFGNLETVLGGSREGYSGYPFFNSPDEFALALKNAGFDLLTTSNNHSLDQGEKGLLRTLETLKNFGINYNGSFNSQRDRDSIRVFNIKGIRVAFLAYSYGTNGIPVPAKKEFLINLIDLDLIKSDIQKARSLKVDIVLVHYHFGSEYQREPNQYQRDVVDKTFKAGADIIIGGHPHVIQPYEFFKLKNSKLESGFAAYSLGNFISNQRKRYTDAGVVLTLEITKNKNNDSLWINKVDFIPTWVYKGRTIHGNEYIIIPEVENYIDSIKAITHFSEISKMEEAFDDTRKILTKYTGIVSKIHK
ncbi:MAG: CapA family protein [Ignavibacteriaceae bacterium]|nr:CapA family protein [Ignavibacteriaceae bacterium]